MSTRALMMIAREDDIPGFNFDSPQNVWKRVRSDSKGVILFRHFDGNPEAVKRDVDKTLDLAGKTMFNSGFNAEEVSSCLISATMKVMPVQATWCPLQEGMIDQIRPVFYYLLILDAAHQKWHWYWWKFKADELGNHTWEFQADPRAGTLTNLMYMEFYDVVEEHIYRNLH